MFGAAWTCWGASTGLGADWTCWGALTGLGADSASWGVWIGLGTEWAPSLKALFFYFLYLVPSWNLGQKFVKWS